ncbi:MAG: type II toxin-antitoxin system VapC family toxin [Nocardioides sp.]|nr:type II toxin-antitoxin system VapC family toxin [Nocardioides sp.]
MGRYVIAPDAALSMAREDLVVGEEHRLLAPSVLRSHVNSLLLQAVRRGELTRKEARNLFDRVLAMRMRLLGDRVLQANAWDVAEELGWPDTLEAEYVALTRMHADALVTEDERLRKAVRGVVDVVPVAVLT